MPISISRETPNSNCYYYKKKENSAGRPYAYCTKEEKFIVGDFNCYGCSDYKYKGESK